MAGIPGLEGVFSSQNLDSTLGILKFVMYGLIGGGVLYLLWQYMSYNIKVEMMERNGAGFVSKWKKGRFKKDKNNPGVFIFQIMGDRRWDQPLDRSYLSAERKPMGRMGTLVRFAEDKDGRPQPVRPILHKDLVQWNGWNNNAMEFTTAKIREYLERFKKGDFWSKYGALIQMGFLAFCLIGIVLLFREQAKIAESLGSVAGALNEVAIKLQPVVQNTSMPVPGVQIIG